MSIRFHALWIPALFLASVAVFADGDSRPTTPQEKTFTLELRKALHRAFAGIDGTDWSIAAEDERIADEMTSPDQRARPYAIAHQLQLAIKPETARMRKLSAAMDSIMGQVQAGNMPPDYVARVNAIQQEQSPTITVYANERTGSFTLFEENGAKWQKIAVAGAKFAVRATKVQSLNGGGEDSSGDATFLYLGAYAEPRKAEEATIAADGGLKPGANYLTLQNLFVRIEAPPATADALIKAIDLDALNARIGK